MKIKIAIVLLSFFLTAGCTNKQDDLRPDMKEVVMGLNYSLTASDSNGQVILVRNASVEELENNLRSTGGTPRINGKEHSVWIKGKVVYQLIESANNVEVIVLDNPPGQ